MATPAVPGQKPETIFRKPNNPDNGHQIFQSQILNNAENLDLEEEK